MVGKKGERGDHWSVSSIAPRSKDGRWEDLGRQRWPMGDEEEEQGTSGSEIFEHEVEQLKGQFITRERQSPSMWCRRTCAGLEGKKNCGFSLGLSIG